MVRPLCYDKFWSNKLKWACGGSVMMKWGSQFEHSHGIMLNHVHCLTGVSLPSALDLPRWERASPCMLWTCTHICAWHVCVHMRKTFCISCIYCISVSFCVKTPEYRKSGFMKQLSCQPVCLCVCGSEFAFIYLSTWGHLSLFPPFFAQIKYDSAVLVGLSLPL